MAKFPINNLTHAAPGYLSLNQNM